MIGIREMWKKILMFFVAGALVLCGATEAFADEAEGIMQEQSQEETIEVSAAPIDYSMLERQITAAIGLDEHDYTKESWDMLEEALDDAIMLLDAAKNQQEVIDTAEKLENAVSALSRMDYSKLEKALGLIYAKIDENAEIHSVLGKVDSAVNRAKGLLLSGDQAAVDAAAAELDALIEELSNIKTGESETIIKEVEIEVPPSDDYCNVAGHKAWPVLFFISLAINVALVVMMGYVFSKMKNAEDDIPLVQYDIDDDMDDFEEYDDLEDYSEEEFDDEYEEEAFEEESADGED